MRKMSALEQLDCEEQSTYKFEAGEKVLCFHGPLIYEAKCQQVRISEETKQPEYLIHYLGWNKSWDEWVTERRILKFNEINVKRQQELERAVSKVKERKVRKKSASSESKESKNSDAIAQSTPYNSSSHSTQSRNLDEMSQPRVVIERHLTTDESTPETSMQSFAKFKEDDDNEEEDDNGKINDEQVHIKQEDNGTDDMCVVNIKKEDEFDGDTSDKESKRISQRRSSRLSVESRTSSQEQETTIKEENDVSEEDFENENEPSNEDGQSERVLPLTQNNVKNSLIDRGELDKPVDAAAKIERRRCSAKSENGSSSLESRLDTPKRRSSADTKRCTSDEAEQKFSATLKEMDQLNVDPKRGIALPPANPISQEPKRIPFKYPKQLRSYLIDDWDFVCRQHKLCSLPAEVTVQKILKRFVSCGSTRDGVKKEKIIEIMNFLRTYFDVALGLRLLHKFERYQYSNMLKLYPSKKMSELYGGPHLLRLILNMEEENDWSEMEKEDYDIFSKVMQSFIKFLILKADVYCAGHVYYFATVDYHREDNLV